MTLGLTLFFYWLGLAWLRRVRPDASVKLKLATLLIISPFVVYPFVYGPVWWLRGLTGDVSVLSTALLLFALVEMIWGARLIQARERRVLWRVVAVAGLVFYPLALGWGQYDPYVWGYAHPYMPVLLLALAGLAFTVGFYATAWVLVLVVLAWGVHVLDSVNLWDYALDPFVVGYALYQLARRGGKQHEA